MMELQLGLALPIGNSIIKESDFKKSYCNYSVNFSEEGHGSSLSSDDDGGGSGVEDENCGRKKCRFDDAFECESVVADARKTLSLLVWNREPNEEDDDPKEIERDCSLTVNKSGGEVDCIVGWPPIKAYRKKLCHQNYNGRLAAGNGGGVGRGGGGISGLSSRYVKVQMEGIVITRKVNLSFLERHQSFESLTNSLVSLFGRGQDNLDGYTLTYLDKEGDWLLAGDVPWRIFIESIQRLKLVRNG